MFDFNLRYIIIFFQKPEILFENIEMNAKQCYNFPNSTTLFTVRGNYNAMEVYFKYKA